MKVKEKAIMGNWKERYKQAYEKFQSVKYPAGSSTFGFLAPKFPDVRTHNGLKRFAKDFLKFEGHQAEMTQNMGRPIQKYVPKFNIFTGKTEQIEGGIDWQKGTGTKGTSDVKADIKVFWQKFPVPVKIEVKVGRDTQRDDQKDYEKEVTDNGALYWLIRTPEHLIELYDDLINNILLT